MVLDADGLNAFKGRAELLEGSKRTLVLTPHPGEMATLLGMSTKEVQANRVELARKFAQEHHLTLVLKGWRTLVAHPDGRVAVNTTGNPGMAKGGSGDILTGIVAAMVAQWPHDIASAVEAAVYLHGLAADLAVQRREERTLLATDTIAHLSDAYRYEVCDENGFHWIAGVRRRGQKNLRSKTMRTQRRRRPKPRLMLDEFYGYLIVFIHAGSNFVAFEGPINLRRRERMACPGLTRGGY